MGPRERRAGGDLPVTERATDTPDPRALERTNFLKAAGSAPDAARPLAGDASNRRYFRLDQPRAMLMDAPPETGEDVRPFVAATHWLRANGFSAPEILAADLDRGFLLLEDLGDALFTPALVREPDRAEALYTAATDLLARLGRLPAPEIIGPDDCRMPLPSYDTAVLTRESALLTEWWIPAAIGAPACDALSADLSALVTDATAEVAGARESVVLRDYHADNLIWLPDRAGDARVGLLDYQDALAGHPAYDLVSLLEDARRDTSEELQQAMIAHYLDRRPELDAQAFRAAYSALGAQRNMKIAGIFARLALRDSKPRYLQMIPRVWAHLARDLAHPALAPLKSWVAQNVPAPEPAILARIAAQMTEVTP